MTEPVSDGVTLIGLHPLSRENDDGAVPELRVLMSLRDVYACGGNIVSFPREATRPPGEIATAVFGHDAATGRNVVAFALPAGKSPNGVSKA